MEEYINKKSEEFIEYFDKTLKPKKPTIGNLDRELCRMFIKETLQEVFSCLPERRYNIITEKRRLTYSDIDEAYNSALDLFNDNINKLK